MKYKRKWFFSVDDDHFVKDTSTDVNDNWVTAYVAENGTEIIPQYGWDNRTTGYKVGEKWFDHLKEAKQFIEQLDTDDRISVMKREYKNLQKRKKGLGRTGAEYDMICSLQSELANLVWQLGGDIKE